MIASDTNFFPLKAAPKKIKQRFNLTRQPHPGSILRWAERGVSGVKLETLFVAGERCTSEEALIRFFEESTAAKNKNKRSATQDSDNATLQREAESLGI